MKTIKLYGDLIAYQPIWQLDVRTPAEALRAINANRPGFLEDCDAGEYIAILFDAEHPELIRQVTLQNANGLWGPEELHIVPRAGGDVPVAAIAGVFALAETSFAAIALTAIINIGISLAVSALANLITSPKTHQAASNNPANNPSFVVNGVVNVVQEGNPFPIIAGEFLCGSIVLSSRILIKDIPA